MDIQADLNHNLLKLCQIKLHGRIEFKRKCFNDLLQVSHCHLCSYQFSILKHLGHLRQRDRFINVTAPIKRIIILQDFSPVYLVAVLNE